MKLKAKIASTMMSMLLALGVMGFAVWAAATQTLVVNNTVSFVSDHVLASIEGTVKGAVARNGDFKRTYLGEVDESTSASNKFDAWEIGDISFGDELVPIEIELKITNKSFERFFTFEIDFVNDVIASDNVVRSVTYDATSNEVVAEGATYTEGSKVRVDKNTVATVVVTLNIADTGKSVDAFENDFSVTLLNLGVASEEQPGGNEGFIFDGNAKSVTIPQGQELRYDNLPDMSAVQGDTLYGFYKSYDQVNGVYSNRVTLPYTAEETNETLFAKLDEVHPALEFQTIDANTFSVKLKDEYFWAEGYSLEIEIPAMYQGRQVQEIAMGGFGAWSISKISIPETVLHIEDHAFSGASYLTEIVLHEGLQTIGAHAFDGSYQIASLVIPNSVTKIEDGAFAAMTALESITLSNSITEIAEALFSDCVNLNNVTIPNGVTTIGYMAFHGCDALTNVVVPDSVHSIKESAFGNTMINLSFVIDNGISYLGKVAYQIGDESGNLTLRNDTKGIASKAFTGNQEITAIAIPASVVSIELEAFASATNLATIDFLGNPSYIGERVFENTAWFNNQSVGPVYVGQNPKILVAYKGTVPAVLDLSAENFTVIAPYAFSGVKNLTSITLPSTLQTISKGAFNYLSSLQTVVMQEGVKRIEDQAFQGTGLTSVTIPNSVEYIGQYAFASTSLEEMNINIEDSNLLEIDDFAFHGLYLTSIHIPFSVQRIGNDAFSAITPNFGNREIAIKIPASVAKVEDNAFMATAYYVFSIEILENPNGMPYSTEFLPLYRSDLLEDIINSATQYFAASIHSTLDLKGKYFDLAKAESLAQALPPEVMFMQQYMGGLPAGYELFIDEENNAQYIVHSAGTPYIKSYPNGDYEYVFDKWNGSEYSSYIKATFVEEDESEILSVWNGSAWINEYISFYSTDPVDGFDVYTIYPYALELNDPIYKIEMHWNPGQTEYKFFKYQDNAWLEVTYQYMMENAEDIVVDYAAFGSEISKEYDSQTQTTYYSYSSDPTPYLKLSFNENEVIVEKWNGGDMTDFSPVLQILVDGFTTSFHVWDGTRYNPIYERQDREEATHHLFWDGANWLNPLKMFKPDSEPQPEGTYKWYPMNFEGFIT